MASAKDKSYIITVSICNWNNPKIKIATTSLAGCFGCHMSFLDMDERLVSLLKHVEFDRSPFTDIKHCGSCDIGLIEGGVCNAENVLVLREFRANFTGTGITNPQIPGDIELPLLLDKVYPVSEVVHTDYFLPGCPPSADEFLQILEPLLAGQKPVFSKSHLHYD